MSLQLIGNAPATLAALQRKKVRPFLVPHPARMLAVIFVNPVANNYLHSPVGIPALRRDKLSPPNLILNGVAFILREMT